MSEPFGNMPPHRRQFSKATSNEEARRKLARKRRFCPALETLEDRITPFKPYTHLAVANEAYADAIDNGKVTIQERLVNDLGQVTIVNHEYAIKPELLSALTDHHDYYQAGALAGDGFPDLLMGQGVLHPDNMGLWAKHLMDSAWAWTGADKPQVLAWSYGFMSHMAADMWAHTFVNEFSGGAFPDIADVIAETAAKSNAIKHIIVEGYVGDATPGYDGNPVRTELFGPGFVRKDAGDGDPNREFSDDSTPGFEFAAPREFIYETLVKAGVGPVGDRGPLIGFFTGLRDGLRATANYTPGTVLSARLTALANAKADRTDLNNAVNAWNACDADHDADLCAGELADLLFEAAKFGFNSLAEIVTAGFNVLLGLAEEAVRTAASAVFGFYLNAWADDIDAGLRHWSELGLGLSNALFNPQARRDTQNGYGGVANGYKTRSETENDRIDGEYGVSSIDVILYELDQDFTDSAHDGKSFIENHLIPMLGFPDFFADIKDVAGDIFNDVQNFINNLTAPLSSAFDFLNPLENAVGDITAYVKNALKDMLQAAFEQVTGINVLQFTDFMSHGSRHLDDAAITIGSDSIPLFGPNDHEKLDAYLGITDPNHHTAAAGFIQDGHVIPGKLLKDDVVFNRDVFAPFGNAVTLTKLTLLDGAGLDQMISDFLGWTAQGNSYHLYANVPNANVMFVSLPEYDANNPAQDDPTDPVDGSDTWLNSIDGSHQWRADDMPTSAGSGGTPTEHSGNGNFPLWESCLLRDGVFRSLFVDWQGDFIDDGVINQSARFDDYGDAESHDRNEITPAAVLGVDGVLTVTGTDIEDSIILRRHAEGGIDYLQVEWQEVRDGNAIYGCGEVLQFSLSAVTSIALDLGDGADALTIDNSAGLLARSITYAGGSGVNVLTISGNPGTAIARESDLAAQSKIVFDPDGNMGVGAAGAANGDELILTVSGLSRIDDVTPVLQLDMFGLADVDGFTLAAGDNIEGFETIEVVDTNTGFVSLQFANKTTASVNGLDGADTLVVLVPTASSGLTSLRLYGNEISAGAFESDDSAADRFQVRDTPNNVNTEVHGGAGADIFDIGNAANSLDDIDGSLTVNGGGNDATPTTSFNSGLVTNTQPVGDRLAFLDQGDVTGGHVYSLSDVSLGRSGLDNAVAFTAVETLIVNAGTSAATVNIVDTPDNSNTFVMAQDAVDVVTISTTGVASNLYVTAAGGDDQLNLRGSGAGSIVLLLGNAGNDVVRISSQAGADDSGNLNGVGGAVGVEAGAGAANRLIVSDFGGDANPNVVVTQSAISGFAGAAEDQPIVYAAVGGAFANVGNDGILLYGADAAGDQFTILSTLPGSTTKVETHGGADQINVGSTQASDDGNLDLIRSLLTLDAGASGAGSRDQIYINDRAKAGRANYTLGPTQLVNFALPASFIPAGPLAAVVNPQRPLFAGIEYHGAEFLRLDGTDDVNIFGVKPSLATEFFIDGNLPPPGACLPGGGDYLALDTAGTAGRKLQITGLGQGNWSFTSGHQIVGFESIERFNHVDILAVGNERGAPIVDVFDAETNEFKFRVSAYEAFFRGGVRVATGDVNCDGLPDVITAPGLGRTATVRAFSGTPDAAGNYAGAQLFELDAYANTFKGGAFVATGDVNGDGALDIITGADAGWLPQVRVFDGATHGTAPALLTAFNAHANSFRGGVRVAAGDLDGDGRAEIVTGSGRNMIGTVSIFSGNGFGRMRTLLPFGAVLSRGLFVAVGDLNGDGVRDVGVSSEGGWLPTGTVVNGATLFAARPQQQRFLALPSSHRFGVRIAAKPTNGGNPGFVEAADLLLSSGPGGGSVSRRIRQAKFNAALTLAVTERLFANAAFNGIFIG